MVLSLDPAVGDFESGDVLIGGKKILAVGRSHNATALGVDASGMIVMPGFVDTHHPVGAASSKLRFSALAPV